MTSGFESFNQSKLGAFNQSQLLARGIGEVVKIQFELIRASFPGGNQSLLRWDGDSWDTFIYLPLAWGGATRAAAVYDGYLYISDGIDVWRWKDGAWEDMNIPAIIQVFSMDVFDGKLYCAGQTVDIYEWNGTSWSTLHQIQDTPGTKEIRTYRSKLFLGTYVAGRDTTIRYNSTDYVIDGCGYFDGTDWVKAHDRTHMDTRVFSITPSGHLWATAIDLECSPPPDPPGEDDCPDRIAVFDNSTNKFVGWDKNRSPQGGFVYALGQIGPDYYAAGVKFYELIAPDLDDTSKETQEWEEPIGGFVFSQACGDALSGADNKVWFGGAFSTVNGEAMKGIARWNGSSFSPQPNHITQPVGVSDLCRFRQFDAWADTSLIFKANGTYSQATGLQAVKMCKNNKSEWGEFRDNGNPAVVTKLKLNGPTVGGSPCAIVGSVGRHLTDTEAKITKAVGQTTGLTLLFDAWGCTNWPSCLRHESADGWWNCGPTSQGLYIRYDSSLMGPFGDHFLWTVLFPPGLEPTLTDECFIITLGS